MSLTLINGDGNPRVLASQDADWYASLTGNTTAIMPVNDNLAATVADSNTIEISSGVCITKEGRRVQVDEGSIEEIIIPTGTQGVDTYYIIGFHLYIDEMGTQVAETFVETMASATDTITETTFKEGSSSIYVSLYRVKRSGLLLESVTRICPIFSVSAGDVTYNNTNVGAELTQINSNLSALFKVVTFMNNSSTSVPANSELDIEVVNYSIPTGYSPIAIMEFAPRNNLLDVEHVRFYDNRTRLNMKVHNGSASAINALPLVTVLFAKSGTVSYS